MLMCLIILKDICRQNPGWFTCPAWLPCGEVLRVTTMTKQSFSAPDVVYKGPVFDLPKRTVSFCPSHLAGRSKSRVEVHEGMI